MDDETPAIAWNRLTHVFWRRSRDPWKHWSFKIYLVLGVLGFGGLGIWLEIWRFFFDAQPTCSVNFAMSEISVAMIAYYPALVGAAALQVIYEAFDTGDKKLEGIFSLLAIAVFIAGAIIASHVEHDHQIPVLIANIVLSIFAIWGWIILAGNQPFLNDSDYGASGGAVTRRLPGGRKDVKV